MRAAYVIEIHTPKKFVLNGLWFGPTKPKKAIIWIHGLCSSAFSRLSIVENLIDDETAVITFNNRGHDTVARISRINPRKKDGYERILAGGAHEIFTDSPDDIQGVIDYARSHGVKEVYLAGHSTGCQKSVYYATRKGNSTQIDGIILLAPISDYASAMHFDADVRTLAKDVQTARALVKKGTPDAMVPNNWQDAQRFLSLNTPDSVEEMFTYAQPKQKPKIYASLKVPVLALFAGADEYSDRPAEKLADWFTQHSASSRFKAVVISDTDHGFKGAEESVATYIKKWILA